MDLHPWAFSYFTTIDWHLGIYIISPPVSLDVQGHILSFGVQSHHHFLSLTFRAAFPVPAFRAIIIVSQFRRSEPLLLRLTFRVIHHRFPVLAFKAIVASQFWRSEPSLFSVLAFKAIVASQFWRSEPSLFSVLAFKAIVASQFWRSEPSLFSVWHSEPLSLFSWRSESSSLFSFGVRAIVASQFWRSEPSLFSVWHSEPLSLFSFGVQSHYCRFSVRRSEPSSVFRSTFRVIIITSQFRRSEPSSVFRSTFRVASSVSAFRVVTTVFRSSSSLLSLTFRVIIITSQFRRSEPSSVFRSTFRVTFSVSAFRAIVTPQFDIQSHIPETLRHFFRRSKPCFASFGVQSYVSLHSVFRAIIASLFGVQSHHSSVLVFRAILIVFSVSAFRAIIGFQIDIQSRIFSFDVQSHHRFSASSAISVILFRLPEPSLLSRSGFQSHHYCLIQASRAITVILFWLPEPLLSSCFGFQSHYCHLVLASRAITVISAVVFLSLVFRVGLVIQSHNSSRSYPLALRILPSWFYILPRFFLTPVVRPLLIFDIDLLGHFWRHLREGVDPWCNLRGVLRYHFPLGLELLFICWLNVHIPYTLEARWHFKDDPGVGFSEEGGPPFRHESSYERWDVQQVKMAGAMLVIGGPCC
ncbi:hypothetical protein CK203_042830 [Vitis vinifera]|uniref:Uncharacterized protein n=1 Tax=Vitis vinifera TaxID=29760 RepID=A0A438HQK9_VITVI|nr:hypothetical protein CK203_042830 [Vitis vinifera]